jgi:hypothetical protein
MKRKRDPFTLTAREPGPRNEHTLKTDVDAWLRGQTDDVWYVKIHGGIHQRAGVADYLLCVAGLFLWLELKHPTERERLSEKQTRDALWVQRAGGVTAVARSVDEVASIVGHLRERALLLDPEIRRLIRSMSTTD